MKGKPLHKYTTRIYYKYALCLLQKYNTTCTHNTTNMLYVCYKNIILHIHTILQICSMFATRIYTTCKPQTWHVFKHARCTISVVKHSWGVQRPKCIIHPVGYVTSKVAFTNQLHSTVVLIGGPVESIPVLLTTTGAAAVCNEMAAGTAPAGRRTGGRRTG